MSEPKQKKVDKHKPLVQTKISKDVKDKVPSTKPRQKQEKKATKSMEKL